MQAAYERSWDERRGAGRSAGEEARSSYYGVPVIHKAHWNWMIVAYFFLGGIAGGGYVIATIAELVGGRAGRPIARAGRYLSFAALLPSPVLLILDLGRPARFLYMLRVVKLRSPMSTGVWGLLAFSGFCTLSAFAQAGRDGLLGRRTGLSCLARAVPTRAVGVLGAGPGLFLAGYTGVLLAATAVPLWTKAALLMGPLFLASALSSAAAAIALVLSLRRGTSGETLKRLERLDAVALLSELGLLLALRRQVGPTIARPLVEGHLGLLTNVGVIGLGIAAPLLLQWKALRGHNPSRPTTALASALVLVGGYLFRHVMVTAGSRSADDPHASFELTAAAP
jgi:formate-dependent nitrite reductase membrane component NrfD